MAPALSIGAMALDEAEARQRAAQEADEKARRWREQAPARAAMRQEVEQKKRPGADLFRTG